ncbi:hypothetical protein [Enterococcus cecorum]|uniref:hypothetical protein n=1 Tax=Enterococcus cecorum TaxID=44008 RepID=UPI000ACCA9D0|nr:hypothetical protein [Enterococcus cecorum]CAI3503894.1 hypothetical protein CIRMBP1309_02041 [Enterococcus cecorum]
MKSILVLHKDLKTSYEKLFSDEKKVIKFKKHGIYSEDDFYKIIIEKINEINSKYGISKIEFSNDPIYFLNKSFKNAGIIVQKDKEKQKGLAYVFLTTPTLEARNSFGAQQIFPGLSKLVEYFIDSPNFELTNLPVYFINSTIENMPASKLETIAAISLMNIRYIQIFEPELVPDTLFALNLFSYSRYISNDEEQNNEKIIYTDYYILDKENKKITFIDDTLKNIESFGSRDRFFVIKSYPALILADRLTYNVDCSKIDTFIRTYNKGCSNLLPFLKYAKKLNERRENV